MATVYLFWRNYTAKDKRKKLGIWELKRKELNVSLFLCKSNVKCENQQEEDKYSINKKGDLTDRNQYYVLKFKNKNLNITKMLVLNNLIAKVSREVEENTAKKYIIKPLNSAQCGSLINSVVDTLK